jgi:hypothetical protein
MSVEVALGTPLAEALNMAIQGKIAELGWANPGTEGSAMSEYFLLMLANGKTESEIAAEIAGVLSAQLGPEPAQSADAMDGAKDDPMDGSFDASMDTSDTPAAGLNA